MAESGIKALNNTITEALEAMVSRASFTSGFLTRVVYPDYQNAQRTRWINENSGEDFAGGAWPALNVKYAEQKKKRFADYEGSGSKMLIATNRLQKSVIGPGEDHQRVIDATSIRINTRVPYAVYVDSVRSFSGWSPIFYSKIYKKYSDYIAKNIIAAEE